LEFSQRCDRKAAFRFTIKTQHHSEAMIILLIVLLIVCWRLIKLEQLNRQYQHLIQLQQQHYPNLGQSIAALTIQLQVVSKLWQVNPVQAQQSLFEAYALSTSLMQEIRQTIKTTNSASCPRFSYFSLMIKRLSCKD
jgi:predicted PurR-regulated permease PerM